MKKSFHNRPAKAAAALLLTAFAAFPSWAAVTGSLDSVTADSITGQAADSERPAAALDIELTISGGNGPGEAFVAKVKTSEKAPHSFSYSMDWDKQAGDIFLVTGEIITENARIPLSEVYIYNKEAKTSIKKEDIGKKQEPTETLQVKIVKKGSEKAESSPADPAKPETGIQGDYLGEYKVSGYCSCEQCSGGHSLTYSGAVPQANHTLAADLNDYPLGTKLMIDGIVYTVEDMGGGINGNHLDIYFATHEEAAAYGLKTVHVYAVEQPETP